MPSEFGTVKQITAGINHTCAIKTDDTVTCWGRSDSGQTTVPTDLGTVKQITAGGIHTCAVKTDDTATCWGRNGDGQASVPTDLGTVKQITAGNYHTCAIKTNDTAACWGYDGNGRTTVPTDLGTVRQITAGMNHTCAIKTNDTATCWGYNSDGQTSVPPEFGTVKQITAGLYHTCAIKTNDTATCWGSNSEGQTSVPTDLGTVKQITAGGGHTCAIKTNGIAACWGSNSYGQTSVPAGAFPSLSGALVDSGDPSGLDFGDVTGGQRSAVLKSFITSSPSLPGVALTIGTVTLTGSGGAAFKLLSQSCTNGQAVTDGASCPLRVWFSPKVWQRGDLSAQVTVTDDSTLGTHTIPLSGTALAPSAFILQNTTSTPNSAKVDFKWETSDDSRVTITIAQRVTTTIKVKKGKKTTTKKVTTIKQLPVTTIPKATAGPGTYSWNRKLAGKTAAKGTWAWILTAKSARGTLTKTATVTLG
ncbi:MAG: hypothetical protein NT122_03810 [Solirubrobacterales bacterium]|nr:hypothetical protein [Solirubrobacterales bacterium]